MQCSLYFKKEQRLEMNDINLKVWNTFGEKDPFNNNFVEGYICRESTDIYGALYIEKVNGDKCPQLIHCTPKLHYPFDKNGNWRFPKAKRIERYTKYDGTNIFSYFYKDAKGKDYLAYKTRLNPYIKNSRFGPFCDMWNELLKAKPHIESFARKTRLHASYEMWGARNKHLIEYDIPLSASLLFVRDGQKLKTPMGLDFPEEDKASFFGIIDKDYIHNYQLAQKEVGDKLIQTEDGYKGDEGEVWWLEDINGIWMPFKCKPTQIEAIHWAAGGINKNIIIATCQNAFENWDEPSKENVTQLLLEEFDQFAIDKVSELIVECLKKVKFDNEFKVNVLEEYSKLGLNILEQKSEVMRALSPKFKKDQMKKVYTILWSHIGK
jgi:hypothetical protein